MKNDIIIRKDIDLLVKLFYDNLLQDDLLQTLFQKTILSHLDKHLNTIADFWDSLLLDGDVYRGNPMDKHLSLNQQFPLGKEEFDRWLLLWKESVDELFIGGKAEHAKQRAQSIADIMLYKIDFLNKNKS